MAGKLDLRGVFCPVVTPFDEATGDIDLSLFRASIARLLDAGIVGILAFGSTGEGPMVARKEKLAGLQAMREAAGESTLLAGIAAESTRDAIALVSDAATAGADAALVAPPAYFLPQLTPDALIGHFSAIADESPIPILLYQVPTAYSGAELSLDAVREIARHDNVVGIKDSTGDVAAIGSLVAEAPDDFRVLVGSGTALYAGLREGAKGGVLAISNLAPKECVALFELTTSGADSEANSLQALLGTLHRAVVVECGVPGVKAGLEMMGLAGGSPRDPLRSSSRDERERIRQALVNAGLLG